MPKKSPYYLPSADGYVTAAQLKMLGPELQNEMMRYWFEGAFDPPDELPYDSGEGGYQWIWGGPYDPGSQLRSQFEGLIPEEVIEQLASEFENTSPNWSGKPDAYGQYSDEYLSDLIASGTDPFMILIGSLSDIEKAAKLKALKKDGSILHKLLFANVISAFETFLGDLFVKTLDKRPEFIENFVRKTGHFQQTKISVSQMYDRLKQIDGEVRGIVQAHVWHRLSDSGKMYQRAFDVKFPDVPEAIKSGIRNRHDIVHRNGKTSEGVEGSWGLPEIVAVKDAVLGFSCELNDRIQALSAPEPDVNDKQIEF